MQFDDKLQNKIVVICGATASGKSLFAFELASKIGGVIINGDALQVYRDIPILTAQPLSIKSQDIDHILYSIIDCGEYFSVSLWLEMMQSAINKCFEKSKIPIVVGGSGLYIKSLVDGISYVPDISQGVKDNVKLLLQKHEPEQLHEMLSKMDQNLALRLAKSDLKRIQRGLEVFLETGVSLSKWQEKSVCLFAREDFFIIHINPARDELYRRCDSRLLYMMENGVIDEVELLLKEKPAVKYPRAIGLYTIISYLNGKISLDDAIFKAQQDTRNYAKRQLTWFRHQLKYNYQCTNIEK